VILFLFVFAVSVAGDWIVDHSLLSIPLPYITRREYYKPLLGIFNAGIGAGGDNAGIFPFLPFAGIVTCKSFVKALDK
jgi:hypothetical protein